MNSEQGNFADHLTFSQRHGYEPLPEPMKLEYLSNELRRELCNAVHQYIEAYLLAKLWHREFSSTGKKLIRRALGKFLKKPDYCVNTEVTDVNQTFMDIITGEPFHRVLTFLEILLEAETSRAYDLPTEIQALFRKHNAAYQLVTSGDGPSWFHPCDSEEQAKAVTEAIETLHQGGFRGSTQHLQKAAEHINGGRYGDAIVDSIHAVESVARKIDPKASTTLGHALKSLERRGMEIHPALSAAFQKLYGYTNDAQGLRHAWIDRDDPSVGFDLSLFMFGACAPFAAYLARKHMAHPSSTEHGEHPTADEGNDGDPEAEPPPAIGSG